MKVTLLLLLLNARLAGTSYQEPEVRNGPGRLKAI